MDRRAVMVGALCGLLVGPATPAAAQSPLPSLPIVVLDREALFTRSQFGRRVRQDIETASRALAAENRQIEEELEREERALTDLRPTVEATEFRALADAFDRKVEGIREAQTAKERAIINQTERAQQMFLERVNPVLGGLAQDVGALVILDRRQVIAAADQVDITQLAIERIDAALGQGGTTQLTPSPRPDETPTAPVTPTTPVPE